MRAALLAAVAVQRAPKVQAAAVVPIDDAPLAVEVTKAAPRAAAAAAEVAPAGAAPSAAVVAAAGFAGGLVAGLLLGRVMGGGGGDEPAPQKGGKKR